jgi:hypothetical protein
MEAKQIGKAKLTKAQLISRCMRAAQKGTAGNYSGGMTYIADCAEKLPEGQKVVSEQ